MVDLGIVGLVLSIFLFIAPSVIYFMYGIACYDENSSDFCWNVTRRMAVVLVVFGIVFLIFGSLTCAFALIVCRFTVNSRAATRSELEGSEAVVFV